jgi:hypothetical protein
MSEKKMVSRPIIISLGVICIVLAASLVGVFAYYIPTVNSKSSTISSLNSQVTNLQNQTASDNMTMVGLQSQIDFLKTQIAGLENETSSNNATIANLQDQLDLLVNWSSSIEDMVLSNPSDWVNKTVMVETSSSQIAILVYPPYENSPWFMELSFGELGIGLVLTPSMEATVWGNKTLWVYGVVRQGEITFSSWTSIPSEVTYYIEAETVVPVQ